MLRSQLDWLHTCGDLDLDLLDDEGVLCLALGDRDRDFLEGLGGLLTHELLFQPDMLAKVAMVTG